jgi:hypothetical protein
MLNLWAFITPWMLLAYYAACLGVPLLVLGLVLRLCEVDRGKCRGAFGSTEAFAWGIGLCLPYAYSATADALS